MLQRAGRRLILNDVKGLGSPLVRSCRIWDCALECGGVSVIGRNARIVEAQDLSCLAE